MSSPALDANQTELQQDIDSNKKSIDELEAKVNFLSDDKLGYFPLIDACLESKIGEYNYKICFFKEAKQNAILLGTWSQWQSKTQAVFEDGQSCGDGLSRKLVVKFRCAADAAIMEVSEPGRCIYEAIVHAPGACGEKSAKEVEKATPSVRLPKD